MDHTILAARQQLRLLQPGRTSLAIKNAAADEDRSAAKVVVAVAAVAAGDSAATASADGDRR